MLYMKGMVIRKLSPPPNGHRKIASWLRVGVWVRVRVGSNLPGGDQSSRGQFFN